MTWACQNHQSVNFWLLERYENFFDSPRFSRGWDPLAPASGRLEASTSSKSSKSRKSSTRWQMLTDADRCWQMLTDADRCWQMLTDADRCWQMLTDGRWGSSIFLTITIHYHREAHWLPSIARLIASTRSGLSLWSILFSETAEIQLAWSNTKPWNHGTDANYSLTVFHSNMAMDWRIACTSFIMHVVTSRA